MTLQSRTETIMHISRRLNSCCSGASTEEAWCVWTVLCTSLTGQFGCCGGWSRESHWCFFAKLIGVIHNKNQKLGGKNNHTLLIPWKQTLLSHDYVSATWTWWPKAHIALIRDHTQSCLVVSLVTRNEWRILMWTLKPCKTMTIKKKHKHMCTHTHSLFLFCR